MSAAVDEVKFTLKAMINKEKTKVLFAEADSDFVDILLSFLTLPLGSIVRIFENHYRHENVPIIGSLNSLQKGLANLDSVHFWTEEGKKMLLDPICLFHDEYRKLKLNIHRHSQPTKYYRCENISCSLWKLSNVSVYYDTAICGCGKLINKQIELYDQAHYGGGFTKKTVSFSISDDLKMAPNVVGSIIRNLSNFGITDLDGAEQISVTFGLNEIMDLLKGSFVSNSPLTDLILMKSESVAAVRMDNMLTFNTNNMLNSIPKRLTLQAILHKSTKKLLFAIANKNFVDFLFSLLTIPLGGFLHLLGSNTNTGLGINNLYMSINSICDDEYLKTKDTKTMLLKPELPPMYLSKNQLLPLVERETPKWYLYQVLNCDKFYKSESLVSFDDPKGDEGSYIKGPGMFMVADDLTVTPYSMMSSVNVLNGLKIPLSDIEEIEFEIGLQEALKIMRASITTTSALTNGLMINPISMKQPKEEKWSRQLLEKILLWLDGGNCPMGFNSWKRWLQFVHKKWEYKQRIVVAGVVGVIYRVWDERNSRYFTRREKQPGHIFEQLRNELLGLL